MFLKQRQAGSCLKFQGAKSAIILGEFSMKNVKHYLALPLIALSLLTLRCDCNEDNPLGSRYHPRVWSISPDDGAMFHMQRVTLEWDYFDDGLAFSNAHIFIFIDTSYAWHHLDERVGADDREFNFDTLTPSLTYYWYVTINFEKNGSYLQTVTERRSFAISEDYLSFGEVHSPVPDSGATWVGINPALSWQVYDPDTIGYTYDIYLGTTDTPPLLVSGLSDLNYEIISDTLELATTYYWRVIAYNNQDTVSGPLWEFTTHSPELAAVYAACEIDALQAPSGYHVMEEIRVRFDSAASDIPVSPLQADSVEVGGVVLNWNGAGQNYSYTEYSIPFIENGQPVDVVVFGSAEVPDLVTGIDFPACTLSIVSPESFDNVPISGFEVTWDGSDCGGTVWLILMDGSDSTGVRKETANDGVDSLTAADLVPLGGQTGSYDLVILQSHQESIDALGYLPESYLRTRVINRMTQINITSQ